MKIVRMILSMMIKLAPMEIVNSTRLKKNKTSLDWHYENTKVIMCQGASILLDNFCKDKCDKVSVLWSLKPFTEVEVKILRWILSLRCTSKITVYKMD